jgi:hypothetical protein
LEIAGKLPRKGMDFYLSVAVCQELYSDPGRSQSLTKYVYMVAAAASALLIAAPMVSAEAATAHVLTIGKTGGTAVSKGAVLTAGLASKTKATFAIGTLTVKCTSATFTTKVTSNPAVSAKALATESVTKSALAKCSVTGATSISVVTNNLPYNATVSAAKGNPVKVSGTSKSKPISLTATVVVPHLAKIICTYTAASILGKASNKGNSINFSGQTFAFSKGSSFCKNAGKTAKFSATYGPVTDTSVKGSPKVFVN